MSPAATLPIGEDRYVTREMSWLAFNRRVLEEAQDPTKPLLERAKFLAIVASNLDEFVMVRVAELWELSHDGGGSAESRAAAQLLAPVREQMQQLAADQYACWNKELVPALAEAGFEIVPPERWTPTDLETLRKYYDDQLDPVLTPLAVDPTRPFPLVANRGIVVAVQLVAEGGTETKNALVVVPAGRRLVAMVGEGKRHALVEDVVMSFLDHLFPGHDLHGRCLFRVTRDGALDIDEEQATDLLSEIEQELSSRERGDAVRLEIHSGGDAGLQSWLVETLHLDAQDVVAADGPLDLTCLFAVPDIVGRADLRDQPMPVITSPGDWEDPFAAIRAREVLLHHPWQSFQPVVEFVEKAADCPNVLAIKQTLYRVSGNSPIVKALIRAARAGKQVTVLIELKARFDEAANIKWARALEEAGAHVIYGLVGYKVHAKLLMVIRREEDGIRRYVHLGTGNYNDKTARMYTDISYLTDNEAIGRDVAALFNMLTGYSRPPDWERLAVAPLSLRSSFVTWIRREAEHARAATARGEKPGGPKGGRIIAKFNSLVDPAMCDELYAASQAGVEIDLIVRGMCILRPGVPGLSETIRVRSIIDRLLEHSRIYYFQNRTEPVYAIASADWMTRNLDRRVECLTRIEAPPLCARLRRILDICLADNIQARVLGPDGVYVRLQPKRGEASRPSQWEMVAESAAYAAIADEARSPGLKFKPRRKGDKRKQP